MIEIYKTMNNLHPIFMKPLTQSSLKPLNYPLTQNLVYSNPHTILWTTMVAKYGKTQKGEDRHCNDLCKCNLCKHYVTNLCYTELATTWIPTYRISSSKHWGDGRGGLILGNHLFKQRHLIEEIQ